MIAKIYCERCKKYEEVEIEEQPRNHDTSLPKPRGGLSTYSIVHQDHILVADIDHEGNVRSHKIIERIENDLERMVASIASKILEYGSTGKPSVSIHIFSSSLNLRRLVISISNFVVLNIKGGKSAMLRITEEGVLFEFENFQIQFGLTMETPVGSELVAFAYHFSDDVYEMINSGIGTGPGIQHAILFDTKAIRSQAWKETLGMILKKNPNVSLLDVGSAMKAIISFSQIVDSVIQRD